MIIKDIKIDLQISLTADSADKIAEYLGYSVTDPVGNPDDPGADPGMNPETVEAFIERELRDSVTAKYRQIIESIYTEAANAKAAQQKRAAVQALGKEVEGIVTTARSPD